MAHAGTSAPTAESLLERIARIEALAATMPGADARAEQWRGDAAQAEAADVIARQRAPEGSGVLLHVYELGSAQSADSRSRMLANAIKGVNSVTQSIAGVGGVFHAAVEVCGIGGGVEWSYGASASGSGVFCCPVRQNPDHQFRETIDLGTTRLSEHELGELVRTLRAEWSGEDYHLMRFNCIDVRRVAATRRRPARPTPPPPLPRGPPPCQFCHAFCAALGADEVPHWVGRFAKIGAGGLDIAEKAAEAADVAKAQLRHLVPRQPGSAGAQGEGMMRHAYRGECMPLRAPLDACIDLVGAATSQLTGLVDGQLSRVRAAVFSSGDDDPMRERGESRV